MADNKSGLGMTGMLISGFVVILMGLVLIGVIADITQTATSKSTQTDSFAIQRDLTAGAGAGEVNNSYWYHLTYGCPMTASDWRASLGSDCQVVPTLTNGTGTTLAVTTDYILNATCNAQTGAGIGDFKLVNSTKLYQAALNTTYASYTYCPTGYMSQSWSRTVLNMVPGFFALAIFLGAIALVMYLLKQNDVLG